MICIVPAGDEGIELATKMAHDLGLPGNDPKNLNKMIDKQYSQDALKEANLRYIRSKEVTSYEEAKEFIKELDGSKFVVKPSIGQSTVGVCICETDEELKEALEINKKIQFSEDVHILIQEYIGGEEFIIDSICCKGHNRVVSGFVYKKKSLLKVRVQYMTMQNLLMQHILILRNLKSTMKRCFPHWVWNMEPLMVSIKSMRTVRF